MENSKQISYLGVLVILLAFAVSLYAYYPALVDQQTIHSEARLGTYWMAQFKDHLLFKDDLLTRYAKYQTPWGYAILFYFISQLANPVLFADILAVLLYVLAAFTLYRLLADLHSPFAGLLGAVVFFISPVYLELIAGGLPRSFALPLLLMFLLHVGRREYHMAAISAILQCLFYPAVFFLSLLTYLMTFLSTAFHENSRKVLPSQIRYLVVILLIGGLLWAGKYISTRHSEFSSLLQRSQLAGQMEFEPGGMWPEASVAPTLSGQIRSFFLEGNFLYAAALPLADLFARYVCFLPESTREINAWIVLSAVFLFFLAEAWREKMVLPEAGIFMFLASIVMYFLADTFFLRLNWPVTYLRFTLPLIGLIVFVLPAAHILAKIRTSAVRVIFQIILIVWIASYFQVDGKNYFIDCSAQAPLQRFLASLPKDALIAAHPRLADNIPLFARRKVFVNQAASSPVHSDYWNIIKERTFDFFKAYYAERSSAVYDFALKNGIDYLVVDQRHFKESYLKRPKLYFEPFNSFIAEQVAAHSAFALMQIPAEKRLYQDGSVFVIDTDALQGQDEDVPGEPFTVGRQGASRSVTSAAIPGRSSGGPGERDDNHPTPNPR